MHPLFNTTHKTEVTLAFGEDTEFRDAIRRALFFSGSIETPVSIQQWLPLEEVSLHKFSGIIILNDNLDRQQAVTDIGYTLEEVFFMMAGKKYSPLDTNKILICKGSNTVLTSSFCTLHGINPDDAYNVDEPIFFWSVIRQNTYRGMHRKPSAKPEYEH